MTLPPQVMMIEADPALLRIAVCNLVDNAIRFNEPADAPVVVRLIRCGGHARVEVADRGVGIPDALKQKIFERHFTVRGELAKGIGLSIVRLISRAHAGDAFAEDNPQGGAVMVISLPLPMKGRDHA